MAVSESVYAKKVKELEAARAANSKVRRDARERIATLESRLKQANMQAMHARASRDKLTRAGNNLATAIERGDSNLIDQAVAEWKKAIEILTWEP